jgi:hypothetical protein
MRDPSDPVGWIAQPGIGGAPAAAVESGHAQGKIVLQIP